MGEELINYYKRSDIQQAIFECAKDREIAVKFDFGFGKRPETLQYKSDVYEFAKQGAVSFHCSEELWHNPLQLSTNMSKLQLEKLRRGWDLLIDIDCPFLEYSQIAADLIVRALKSKGIKSTSVKFSGNHGFHIGVPFEAFPDKIRLVKVMDTKEYFPDGVRIIALYIQEMIRPHLEKEILKREDITKILKKTGKQFSDLVVNGKFDPFKILSIDSILISSRHLFRMPYSVNEKSGLVSIPIEPEKIREFNKEYAKMENVKVKLKFLERENVAVGEAKNLFDDAIGWHKETLENEELNKLAKNEKTGTKRTDFEKIQEAIPEAYFPPCMKKILEGLEDGKKRGLFALTNFLSCCGWSYEKIEELAKQWNLKNKDPLKEVYLLGQLRYQKQHQKTAPPYNCPHTGNSFFKELGVCNPDNLCFKIKNPVSYSKKKIRAGYNKN